MCNHYMLSRVSPEISIVIILAVGLFCWLFNAYRLGKIKKAKPGTWDKKKSDRIAVLIVALLIIAAALTIAALESFLRSFPA